MFIFNPLAFDLLRLVTATFKFVAVLGSWTGPGLSCPAKLAGGLRSDPRWSVH